MSTRAPTGIQYSIPVPVGSIGNGLIAKHELECISRHFQLQALFAPSPSGHCSVQHTVTAPHIPLIGRTMLGKRINWIMGAWAFDRAVSRHILPGALVHGWALFSERSLMRARALGCRTIVERGALPARLLARLLDEEYELLGLKEKHFLCSPWFLARAKREYELADVILCPSKLVVNAFAEEGYGAKTSLCPLGVDTERFHPIQTSPDKNSSTTVLYVGSIEPLKGVHYLVRAFADLQSTNTRLVLVGHGSTSYLRILRAIHDSFEHLPFMDHEKLAPFMRRATVCVVPSIQDGFALTTLEALASGLPVIVSDMVGARDLVSNGNNGFVVPTRSAANIRERLEYILGDPQRAFVMGQAARETALDFSWPKFIERLAGCYRAALSLRNDHEL